MSNAIQKILKLFEEVAQNEGLFAEKMPEISELLKSFTNEDGKIILTKEQETFVKENGYDVNAFKETLVYADKLSKEIKQGNEVQENDSKTAEDEKTKRVSLLKQTLLNTYVRSKPKSIQQLKDEERTSEIARDYHKLRDKIEVEFLMQMNDNGKTFVHTLFEQNADVEDILFYLNQVNKHSPNILDSYLEISHDGITVNDLLREKAHTPKYSKLLDLNLGIDLATKKTIISEINTHTESVHKSVDQSFVRLANQYIARSFPSEKEQKSLCDSLVPVKDVSKSVANTIKINRNNSWKSKIDADLQKFEDDLKNKIELLNSDNRDNLMKELYPTGYTEVELKKPHSRN